MMNNLQSERKRLGLTRKQLAEKIGRSEAAIGKWERGESSPALMSDALKLATVFGCSTDYLCGLTEERTPAKVAEQGATA